ncbi:MAG: hypothetical protein K2X86_17055 [Cytophagaceae bacterium]|nr:hypothetical protein [Cytophagaceae bacterium]
MIFLQDNFIIPDGGPVYAETDLSHMIAEPYNAISSLAYCISALYWFIKLKGKYRNYSFLTFCLPLLVLGGLGSTFYHAFRISPWLLFMDVFPIAVLTLMVSIYFWIKILPKWWYVFFILIPFAVSRYIIFHKLSSSAGGVFLLEMDRQTTINASYLMSGVMIFLPAMILLYKQRFTDAFHIVISCVLFILGLIFRETDTWEIQWLPIGTHWLWHISTATGSYFLGEYLYRLRDRELVG